jgi:hypothetical protein
VLSRSSPDYSTSAADDSPVANHFLLLIEWTFPDKRRCLGVLEDSAGLLPNFRMRDFGPRPTLGDVQRTTPWVWLPASCAAGLRRRRHPVRARGIKRQTARRRALHKLRRERRNTPTSGVGRQSRRLLSVSDQHLGRNARGAHAVSAWRAKSVEAKCCNSVSQEPASVESI